MKMDRGFEDNENVKNIMSEIENSLIGQTFDTN